MIKKIRNILLVLPIIITVIIIGNTFLGFYFAEFLNQSDSLFIPIIFATIGLGISIVFSLFLIKKEIKLG
jgi:hypothetical protein